MGHPSAVAPGLVRITVTSGTATLDVALPSAVCVADILPELARCVGMLDVDTAYGGYRAVTRDGRVLRPDLGLTAQGVGHGHLITIVAGVDDQPPQLCDDAVEAMASVMEREVEAWPGHALRRAGLWSAVVMLLLAAGGLLTRHGSDSTFPAAAATAALLIVGAVVSSRAYGATLEALVMGNLACVHAAVAGLCLVRGDLISGAALELSGGGALAVCVSIAVGVGKARVRLVPAAVVGAVCLATGLLIRTTALEPAPLLTLFLAVVVVASGGFPGLALGAAGGGRHVVRSAAMGEPDQRGIDLARLASDARRAREILVTASATAGILFVALAPVAVSGGPAGAAVPILGCAVLMLRTRRYRCAFDVLLGLGSGVLTLVSTAVSVLWWHGACRYPVAVLASLGGVLLLGQHLWPSYAVARRGWLADRLETALLVAFLPVVVLVLVLETL